LSGWQANVVAAALVHWAWNARSWHPASWRGGARARCQ
jgi:hypothetical protein